ncbi:hypothetical protein AMEX_G24699, partial [Astyanax mexicanus]
VIGYLGETITINCPYPEEFQNYGKGLYKEKYIFFNPVIRTTDSQIDRFSISEDRRSGVVSVRIRDVREDDGGVYYCGADLGGESVSYESLYTQIHLQVRKFSLPESKPQHQPIRFSLPEPKPQHQPIRFSLPEPKPQHQPIRFCLPYSKPLYQSIKFIYKSIAPNKSN